MNDRYLLSPWINVLSNSPITVQVSGVSTVKVWNGWSLHAELSGIWHNRNLNTRLFLPWCEYFAVNLHHKQRIQHKKKNKHKKYFTTITNYTDVWPDNALSRFIWRSASWNSSCRVGNLHSLAKQITQRQANSTPSLNILIISLKYIVTSMNKLSNLRVITYEQH